jgi:hypothetical protein
VCANSKIFCGWRARRAAEDFYGTGKAPRWRGGSMIDVTRNVQGHDTNEAFIYRAFCNPRLTLSAHILQLQPRHLADATLKKTFCSRALR